MAAEQGHRHFTFLDMARLTVDEDGNICLDGKPIEVKRKFFDEIKSHAVRGSTKWNG